MSYTKERDGASLWKRLLLSPVIVEKGKAQKIAYVGLMTAFCVVSNMFFEIKFLDVQFSLNLFVCALTGILIGGVFGFCACFLGDLVGFLYNSQGYAYMPWIGLAMGCVALLAGLLFNGWNTEWSGSIYVKTALLAVSSFLVSTVGINTTAFWLVYAPGVPYWTYLTARLFVAGQIWNSLANYALLFVALPLLKRVKGLPLSL